MTPTDTAVQKPIQVYVSGESPRPRAVIPPQLAKELAKIIAAALVADYYADSLKACAAASATEGATCE